MCFGTGRNVNSHSRFIHLPNVKNTGNGLLIIYLQRECSVMVVGTGASLSTLSFYKHFTDMMYLLLVKQQIE